MNAFMLWMSGNGVQIFSVMITGMLFFQPIKALMGIDGGKYTINNINICFHDF
jgi:hypothetical protein